MAEETERQRESLPRAIKRVSRRIVYYYVGAAFVLGLNISANDPILKEQLSLPHYPGSFIVMLQRANIPELTHVVNAVMIVAAISVANADIYVGVQHCI
jgi:amino acid transporter